MQPVPDFIGGHVLLIDKGKDWTSFDVVKKVRNRVSKLTGKRKIKVGHAGTLDPLATGLLILCTGKMTKRIAEFQGQAKVYEGEILLGQSTPSLDLETEVSEHFETSHITEEMIRQTAEAFTGEIEQVPPVFSALKVDGKRAYKQARKGREVKLEARKVQIHEFEITNIEMPRLSFRVKCSKGTYIRSLACDFGKALDSGALLSYLRRTHIGDFDVKDALTIQEFDDKMKEFTDAKHKDASDAEKE